MVKVRRLALGILKDAMLDGSSFRANRTRLSLTCGYPS